MFVFSSRYQSHSRGLVPPGLVILALLALGAGLSGCASVGDSMSSAFADPAKYDLYECRHLEPERARLSARAAELQGLMAKAETGVAGPVVAEMAYRNELIATRAQQKLAEEAWQRNKCHETPPEAKPDAAAAPPAPTPGIKGSRSSARSR
jgi:hypothetical protein